jgi:dihydrofolate synthase/folylpolyglutamate synthase
MSDISDLPDIKLSLFPDHQIKNASGVITTLLLLRLKGFPEISSQVIYTELEKLQVPGRFQRLIYDPMIVYDPAHNYDALNNLIEGLKIYYPDRKKKYILSMMKDKADNKTLDLLKDSDVIYYLLHDERAYIPDENKFKLIVSDKNIIIDILQKLNKDEYMIVFTGTFRIYEHALYISQILKKQDQPG